MTGTPALTVALCTHNPRADFLSRTIEGLRAQTLPKDQWSLLIIDNASTAPLIESAFPWDGSLLVYREERLGLVNARLAAISNSTSELIIFVDDDNVLDPDFLVECLQIAHDFPRLGAWGGGTRPDFVDGAPEEWTRKWWGWLAISGISSDCWASVAIDGRFIPFGAGLVVRRQVAECYTKLVRQSPQRQQLDRVGNSLSSCGDTDLALTAVDMGLGVGRFSKLQMIHIIPQSRLTEVYLMRLVRGMSCSARILDSFRPAKNQPVPPSRRWRDRLRDAVYHLGIVQAIVSPEEDRHGPWIRFLHRSLKAVLGPARVRNMGFLVANIRGQNDAVKQLRGLQIKPT